MNWHTFFFLLFSLIACSFAVAVVLSSNIVRMAFYLVLSLGATAGLFFLAGSDFIGAMQLLIYVGGTLVLLVFGVMLTAQSPFISMKTRGGDWVLAAARYASKELRCTQIYVDNLAKCVKGEEDYDGQKLFVDRVCTLGMDTGMHMHLIHHLRKGADEMECPGKMAIKGSGAITDQVDNVAIVWRNKRKEEEREQRTPRLDVMEQPDGVINVVKQRNGEWEGKVGLWYDPESMAYGQGKLEPSRTYDVRADIRIAR